MNLGDEFGKIIGIVIVSKALLNGYHELRENNSNLYGILEIFFNFFHNVFEEFIKRSIFQHGLRCLTNE